MYYFSFIFLILNIFLKANAVKPLGVQITTFIKPPKT